MFRLLHDKPVVYFPASASCVTYIKSRGLGMPRQSRRNAMTQTS
jgi:hypothetical protein